MRHLSEEVLAGLVDEAPTEAEEAHLRSCPACARRLRELEEQTVALASLPALRPSSDDWDRLEARLRQKGLVRDAPSRRATRDGSGAAGTAGTAPARRGPGRNARSSWLQAAAALVLFLGGTAFGAWMEPAGGDGSVAASSGPGRSSSGTEMTAGSITGQEVSDLNDAAFRLRSAEERYVEALMTYRSLLRRTNTGPEDPGEGENPAARFAALEALVAASQEAIRQAPADPFFNGVLASTMAERQAAIRQISTSDDDSWF